MPATAPELGLSLTDDHWRCRKEACEKILRLDTGSGQLVFNRLTATLSDGNLRVRRAGASTLAGMCLPEVWGKKPAEFGARAVSELTCHLADADPLVRKVAREPLDQLQRQALVGDVVVAGQAALPQLKARLADEDWQVRDATVRALGTFGPGALSLAQDMARLLADDSAVVRGSAKNALDSLVGVGLAAADLTVVVQPNVRLFVQRLKHEDPKVRCAACWALGFGAGTAVGLATMADLLVIESNPLLLLVTIEAMGFMGLEVLAAAPELGLCLKTFLSQAREEDRVPIEAADEAVRQLGTKTLLTLHQEIVKVIGRAIGKNPRVKDAVDRAQHYASRIGRKTHVQREEGVEALMGLQLPHVAAITELLRIILDPACPGAQAGAPSLYLAIETLEKFREAKLMGGMDMSRSGTDMVKGLLVCLEDESWQVRLASAEALAKLSCAMRAPLNCIRKHKASKKPQMQEAATILWQKMEDNQAWLNVRQMSESAIRLLRTLSNSPSKAGNLSDQEKQFIRTVASSTMKSLIDAGLAEKSGLSHEKDRKKRETRKEDAGGRGREPP
ncbi:unnamed protein product [Effrenium voratum]|uniref:Uncharacterized protein n=1 Tax=Effrenium voratum TaxID=2562239 RepID=A0AA36N6X7_9DINO|nr:unnamed protein product [Effrenium voratum]